MANYFDKFDAPASQEPRGIRNNNPGNIEDGNFARSQPGYAGGDGRFARFETADNGLAAMDQLLQSYARRGINTPAGIINRWAPSADGNPVTAYSEHVARGIGVGPGDQIDMSNPETRRSVALAMAEFENGKKVATSAPKGNYFDKFDAAPAGPESKPKVDVQIRPTGSPAPFAERFSASEQPKPDMGVLPSVGEGLRQGATFNFGDELAGASAAGMAGMDMPPEARISMIGKALSVPVGVARMIYEKMQGEVGPATKAYALESERVKQQGEQAQEQHPGAFISGNLAGAAALPVGGALSAASLPARMGRGAIAGAAMGGLAGAGDGTDGMDRASRATVGAGLGAAVGGLAPPVLEGGAQLVGALAAKPASLIRSAINPDAQAARIVAQNAEKAAQADPAAVNRLTTQEMQGNNAAMVMDTMGERGRDLARSAANLSPEGRDTLSRNLSDRYANQSGRVKQWLNDAFNYPDAHAQQQAIEAASRAANRPAYAKAYADGQAVWDAELDQLAQAPAVQNAIRMATVTGKNQRALDGFPPIKSPFVMNRQTGALELQPGMIPNLQFWDHVKRNLDGMGAEGSKFAKVLRDHLDQVVPSYQTARQGAAGFFKAEDAMQAGQNFVTENFAVPQTRAALARMSAQERQLFQDGFVSRYLEILDKIPDRSNVIRSIYNSPTAREKFELALGPQKAREFEVMLRAENIFQASNVAVGGNSSTVRQMVALGLAGASGGAMLGADPSMSGIASVAAGLVKGRLDARVAQRVADILVSRDPQAFNQGVKMISKSRALYEAIRDMDNALATKLSAQQLPNGSGASIQGMIPSRAGNENPNPERERNQ